MEQLKKIFLFKSSSSNGTDQQIHRKKETVLTRSRSSADTSSNDPKATRSSHNRHKNLSSSFRNSTPEKQSKKREHSHKYKVHDSSNVSSKVKDHYIDEEQCLESSKQKINSSHRLPSRSGTVKEKQQSNGTTTRTNLSKAAYEHIRTQDERLDSNLDVFADLPLAETYEPVTEYYTDEYRDHQEVFLHDKNKKIGAKDADSELEKKYKEAEKRVKLLSQQLKEKNFLLDCNFDVSSLIGGITQIEKDRVSLAFEVLSLLRSQIDERASSRKEIRQVKTDSDLAIKRLEKEKKDLQYDLDKELDKRSSEWTLKIEKSEQEKTRLRRRVRDLAEHNVTLQREISTFNEKETELIDTIKHLDETVLELNTRTEKMQEEKLHLQRNLSKLQEIYTETTKDLDSIRRDFEDKEMECRELNKTVTRFLRTWKDQEKTIQGLKDSFAEEINKQPLEMIKKSQMEQMRLTEIEFSLRKEVESMRQEVESLRRENISLVNRVKENGEDMGFKLDNEMKMRVNQLQDQGVTMLNDSTELCYKFLKFIKEKLSQFLKSYPDTESINKGLIEQFLIESETRLLTIRRGTESLKRSLETVTSLLFEKSNEISESVSSTTYKNQSVEESLRIETLITRLLKEKLYSKEKEIEELQAQVSAGVRCNEVLQNVLDNIPAHNHQLKDLNLLMEKKDETINWLKTQLQQAVKDFDYMDATLSQALEEKEILLKEVKENKERNMEWETEMEMMKKKIEELEDDILLKEGQITILKNAFDENKSFDPFSNDKEFSFSDFLDS